jgi:hypothetical protein
MGTSAHDEHPKGGITRWLFILHAASDETFF